ncbi:MAG: SDR family oxidoreductase [Prevotellaceae bacterium]|nr:SDR family oxidoreductase [Prevotellaceae bacterium]
MKTTLFDVQGKVAVITGATGILCSAMAEFLAAEGVKIAVLGRRAEAANRLVDKIVKAGGEAAAFLCDVTDKGALEEIRTEVLNKWGHIDILINGAGGNIAGANVGPTQSVFDVSVDDLRKVVDVNLFGTIIPTLVFAEAMVKQGKGSIINLASLSSIRPLTRVGGYSAAKAAVQNHTQWMAVELATKHGEGVRVNSIAPGFLLTEQNRNLMVNPDGSFSDRAQKVMAKTPFKRLGRPEELLGAVLYLASDASKFVTGSMLIVDGGFDAMTI